MLATIGNNLLAFQPPCMPTDKQANQIMNSGSKGPYKVFMIGDDILDLGALNTDVDEQPRSGPAFQLGTRSFLHQLDKTRILQGKIDFVDCSVATYRTLTEIVTDIATHYQKDLAVVGHNGGRISDYVVIALDRY